MNIKNCLCFVLLAGFSFASYSQTATPPSATTTTFSIRAGVNFQNLNGKDAAGDKLENKLKVGFNAGVLADIPVAAPDYFVQTGLLFSTKGAKVEGFDEDVKVKLSYLEVPITFLYTPVLGEGRLLMGIGPYIGFAIGGKVDDTDIEFDNEITEPQSISGTPYFKRFDAGGNVVFGYLFTQNLSAQLNAQLGLVNIMPKIQGGFDNDATIKNTGFGISLGYRF
ncbi:MAG: PorT family protein [Chitinophagaceae bacterium]|nr:PorT family protein [Chitinophagaceae bacterium]